MSANDPYKWTLIIHYPDSSKDWRLERVYVSENVARAVQGALAECLDGISYISVKQVCDLDAGELKLPVHKAREKTR